MDFYFQLGLSFLLMGCSLNSSDKSSGSKEFEKQFRINENIAQINNSLELRRSNSNDDNFQHLYQKAFPDAYGAGAFATGGRGKPVYLVKNLNDSGLGSLRWAISEAKSSNGGNILFDVSGIIVLKSWLKIDVNNLTIAGQSAPEGGITLSGTKIKFQDANNLIIRYLRFRPEYGPYDALELINVQNAILDHLSVSWGGDETISLKGNCDNITFQRLLIAEGKTGSLFGDSNDASLCENLSFLSSLFVNISHRTPNVNSNGRVDIINNVIQNWQYRLTKVKGSVMLNHINNYYAIGENTFLSNRVNSAISSDNPQIYSAGNIIDHGIFLDPEKDNWFLWKEFEGGLLKTPLSIKHQVKQRFVPLGPELHFLSAKEAFTDVTGNVGCNHYIKDNLSIGEKMDDIDLNYLSTFVSGNKENFIPYKMNSQGETYTKGEKYLNFHRNKSSIPYAIRPENWDEDQNGIPDLWEKNIGLGGDLPHGSMSNGTEYYTKLEQYLNIIDIR
jgi:pectate lyase